MQTFQTFFRDVFETKHNKPEYCSITQPISWAHLKFWKSNDITPRMTTSKWHIAFMYIIDWVVILITYLFALMFASLGNPDIYVRFPVDPELLRTAGEQTISVPMVVLIGAIVPVILVVLFSITFVRDGHDFNHCVMGILFALALSTFFTDFLWLVLGGPRPKFFQQCDPDMTKVAALLQVRKHAFNDIVYLPASEICKTEIAAIGFLMHTPGMPSGHASNVFAGWIFVLLYVGAKIGAWAFSTGPTYKMLIVLPSLLVPMYVAATRVLNHEHFPHQVVVGSVIGIASAVLAYRLRYCSLFGLDAHVPSYYMTKRIATQEKELYELQNVAVDKQIGQQYDTCLVSTNNAP
jgi:diacylglycerol diphosphate phosphatase/phosphatidate phosphatase